MTATLQLSRDTHVYIGLGAATGALGAAGYRPNATLWKLPVLDGFSFSQATATTEVTLNEMQDSTGASNRGRALFTDALEPAEWSFSTYARPVLVPGTPAAQTAVEEILWAMFFGAKSWDAANKEWDIGALADKVVTDRGTTNQTTMKLGSQDSDRAELGTFDLYFVLGGCTPGADEEYYSEANGQTIYKLAGCVVNSAGVDFDIDGITTLNWSGFGATVSQLDATETIDFKTTSTGTLGRTGVTSTTNFLRNRIASLSVVPVTQNIDGASTGFASGAIQTYSVSPTALGGTPVPGSYTTKVSATGVTITGSGALAEFAIKVNTDGSYTVNLTAAGNGFASGDVITINAATGLTNSTGAVVAAGTGNIVVTVGTAAAAGDDFQASYNLILTGGSINMENNITFLTPEELCRVNTPIGHITGSRTVSGSFTCYLNDDASGADNKSAAFFRDLASATHKTRNEFALAFTVGSVGGAATDLGIKFEFPTAHIDIPTHQIEDVISLETNFHALPSSITEADEVVITYKGK
tara:strand:- start:940 stop:2517 length:1578 start_codon:yes stop_codon:yes gene_type:complete